MTTGQRSLYAERIACGVRALKELASRGEAPPLAALASAARMSEFHVHRIFRLMTGESVGEAITRVRLGHGLSGLAPGADLREATERSGYATSQAFSRALKDQIGATPGALRSDPERRVNAA
jgi:AraC family transcriptional regulator